MLEPDPRHLNVLKKGASQWNKWRKKNKFIRPSLAGADLRAIKLNEANLEGANLRGANLLGAKLKKAKLGSAF
jgi:uncharacterized protein YjbI with pentapeptide repeats